MRRIQPAIRKPVAEIRTRFGENLETLARNQYSNFYWFFGYPTKPLTLYIVKVG